MNNSDKLWSPKFTKGKELEFSDVQDLELNRELNKELN